MILGGMTCPISPRICAWRFGLKRFQYASLSGLCGSLMAPKSWPRPARPMMSSVMREAYEPYTMSAVKFLFQVPQEQLCPRDSQKKRSK